MATKSVTNFKVGYSGVEIIDPTDTDKSEDRVFSVENGEKTIEIKAWGLDETETWKVEDTKIIEPFRNADLVVGQTHMPRVKLTGKTTSATDVSYINATLTYMEP